MRQNYLEAADTTENILVIENPDGSGCIAKSGNAANDHLVISIGQETPNERSQRRLQYIAERIFRTHSASAHTPLLQNLNWHNPSFRQSIERAAVEIIERQEMFMDSQLKVRGVIFKIGTLVMSIFIDYIAHIGSYPFARTLYAGGCCLSFWLAELLRQRMARHSFCRFRCVTPTSVGRFCKDIFAISFFIFSAYIFSTAWILYEKNSAKTHYVILGIGAVLLGFSIISRLFETLHCREGIQDMPLMHQISDRVLFRELHTRFPNHN